MAELRGWVGLKDLSQDLIADKEGFGFNNALACRWMRNDQEWSQSEWEKEAQNCLYKIEKQRAALGANPFTVEELAQLTEKRYTNEPIVETFINGLWNPQLYAPENADSIYFKTWLDQGGDVMAM